MKYFAVLIISMILLSCSTDGPYAYIDRAIIDSEQHAFAEKDYLLIIPNAGCEGCITEAENFFMNNLDTEANWQVILTGIKSMKTLRLKLGAEASNHVNVYLDTENHFYDKELVSFYPTVVYMENGRAKDVLQQSPENPTVLADLELRLLALK